MIKYLWSAAGYGLIAVPLLFTRAKKALGDNADALQDVKAISAPVLDTVEAVVPDALKVDAVAGRTESM